MSEETSTEIEKLVHEAYAAMAALDVNKVAQLLAEDMQGVDELTQEWKRGRAAIGEHLANLDRSLDHVESSLVDMAVRQWTDTAVATFVVEQVYTIQDERHQVSAPTTMLFRREQDGWKIVLFQSIPLRPAG